MIIFAESFSFFSKSKTRLDTRVACSVSFSSWMLWDHSDPADRQQLSQKSQMMLFDINSDSTTYIKGLSQGIH